MTQTTAYDIASSFLKALGAPDTPEMRRAVTIWLSFESSSTVIGGNPWNLHVGSACMDPSKYCPISGSSMPGLVGNRYAGTGDKNVAVFDSVTSGTKAAANNLISLAPSYGYGTVIKEARAGNAIGFLTALQNSGWSAGHYNHSKLVNSFNSGGGKNFTVNLTSPASNSGTSGNTSPTTPTATQTSFNPLDPVASAIGDATTGIQKVGVWFGIFFLGAMILLAGVLLLTKGPAESAAKTAAPLAAAAA